MVDEDEGVTNDLIPFDHHAPALIASAGERPQTRFIEFFTAQIRNPNTRRAYAQATGPPQQKRRFESRDPPACRASFASLRKWT